MSPSQSFLPWIAHNAFFIVLILCLLVVALVLYRVAFQRHVFPFMMDRRVSKLAQKSPSRRVEDQPEDKS